MKVRCYMQQETRIDNVVVGGTTTTYKFATDRDEERETLRVEVSVMVAGPVTDAPDYLLGSVYNLSLSEEES